MGLIDLLHYNMHYRKYQLLECDNVSHNWETESQTGLEEPWDQEKNSFNGTNFSGLKWKLSVEENTKGQIQVWLEISTITPGMSLV